jgi:virulence factor Mce-like protein
VQGSAVEISGVTIGKVVGVQRAGNGAQATVQIQSRYAPIRAGATAIARTKTLLGEAYIELAPGSQSARPIPDGGQLAAGRVLPNVQLDQFLQAFGPRTRQRMRELFGGLSAALANRSQALNDSLGWAAPLAGSLDQVLAAVDGQRTEVQDMLASSAKVLAAIGSREGLLQSAVTAGDAVLAATAQRDRALAATVRALPPFLEQLRATSNTITADSPDLNTAVGALLPVAPLVLPALDEIRHAAPQFRLLFRALPAAIMAGRRGLPALSSIVGAARGAVNPV